MRNVPVSPLSLPERRVGNAAIRHQYEECVPVVTLREAILTGRSAHHARFDPPLRVHQMVTFRDASAKSATLWMTDLPVEVRQMAELIESTDAHGSVLVGGLGLGLLPALLAQKAGVEKVTIVEINNDVINLVSDTLPSNCTVVHGDIVSYVASMKRNTFDAMIFDTWRGDGASQWWESVFPLRRLLGNKFGLVNASCWAESIMLGQIVSTLLTVNRPHWHYRMPDLPMSREDAELFVNIIGTPMWEKRWGKFYPKRYPASR